MNFFGLPAERDKTRAIVLMKADEFGGASVLGGSIYAPGSICAEIYRYKKAHLVTWVHTLETISDSKQSLPHLQETISTLPWLVWCFPLSSGFSPAAAEKQSEHSEHSELRKEQSSLARVETPFSALLYLSIAPASSPDEIRKVGQWRAKEGCSTGTLEAGTEADEGAEERWVRGRLWTEDISPCLKPGSRRSLSWFDFLLCCSTFSAHCNGCWVWTRTWQLQVKRISHLKEERCLFSSAMLLALLSKWTSEASIQSNPPPTFKKTLGVVKLK